MYHVEQLCHTRSQNISQWRRQSKKSKQNKPEQELKASDGHHILFTFILHSPQENSTISKKKKTKKKKKKKTKKKKKK
jgi:C4-type Zn-finger protein